MKNWIRKIKNFFWNNQNDEVIKSKFPLEKELESIEIKEYTEEISTLTEQINSNENVEEFPTLTHHKIELEKKPQLKKRHVVKKKKISTHLTPKQHHSKNLIIKLPKTRKNKKVITKN